MPGGKNSSRRSPGKTFPSKYEQDVAERVDFRTRMRAELKAMARDSFMEEIERMKHVHPRAAGNNNNSFDAMENERTQQLELEVQRLNQVVEDLRQGQGQGGMQVEWSSPFSREQRVPGPGSGRALNSPRLDESMSFGASFAPVGSLFASSTAQQVPPQPVLSNQVTQNVQNNNMFVLSCAPINGFSKVISQQEDSAFLGPQLSLVEQAQRFAEMQSLFQLPAHLSHNDPLYLQQQQWEREMEEEKMRRAAAARAQKEKLQSTIESHKDRLEKSRNAPRRFPMDAKPSMQSPRVRGAHGRSSSLRFEGSLSLTQSTPQPLTMQALQDTAAPAAQSLSLSLTAPAAVQGGSLSAENGGPAEPANGEATETKRPKTMSLEEFEQKSNRLQEDIQSMVRQVVHDEMVADGQAQHYTKRFQNKLISNKKELLVDKIEKSVAAKIEQLQKELEDLKEQRVKGKRRAALLPGDDEDDKGDLLGDLLTSLSEAEGVDGKALSNEINRSVEFALRRFLSPERMVHNERSSMKMMGMLSLDDGKDGAVEKSASSRVHGRINANSYTPMEPMRESIGFDSQSMDYSSGAHAGNASSAAAGEASTAASSAVPEIVLDEPPVVKPKSKADRLLGISTDAKSGLPVNDALTSTKQGNGLFGSIGSLFSAKPGSGPPTANSMVSGFGMSSRPVASIHPSPTMNRHTLVTIVDEGAEDQSEKDNSQGGSSKLRRKRGDSTGSLQSSDMSSKNSPATHAGPPVNPQLVSEIAAEEANYRTQMSSVLSLTDVKTNIKKELKDWQVDFQNKYGRVPSVEDKMAVNDRFIAYKMVCTQVQEAKDLAKSSEEKLKELREKLANS